MSAFADFRFSMLRAYAPCFIMDYAARLSLMMMPIYTLVSRQRAISWYADDTDIFAAFATHTPLSPCRRLLISLLFSIFFFFF